MSKKQTAVNWLIDTMHNSQGMEQHQIDEVFEQALRMEREQIGEAYKDAQAFYVVGRDTTSEQYYTQTFKP